MTDGLHANNSEMKQGTSSSVESQAVATYFIRP